MHCDKTVHFMQSLFCDLCIFEREPSWFHVNCSRWTLIHLFMIPVLYGQRTTLTISMNHQPY